MARGSSSISPSTRRRFSRNRSTSPTATGAPASSPRRRGRRFMSQPAELGPPPSGEDPYERNNRWMLDAASRFGPDRVDFVCLWNGEGGDGAGRHAPHDGGSPRQRRAHGLARHDEIVGLTASRRRRFRREEAMPKPICFMIMPYGRKPTQVEPSSNAPGEIDFNALWDRAFAPTIQALGYEPVRADQDTGALIITQMIERLYFADLVLADMTIPNGNVYYEIGVRHAAQGQRDACCSPPTGRNSSSTSRRCGRSAIRSKRGTLRMPPRERSRTRSRRQSTPSRGGIRLSSHRSRGIRAHPDPSRSVDHEGRDGGRRGLPGRIRAVRARPMPTGWARPRRSRRSRVKSRATASGALAVIRLVKDCADTTNDWSWFTAFIDRLPSDIAERRRGSRDVRLCARQFGEAHRGDREAGGAD